MRRNGCGECESDAVKPIEDRASKVGHRTLFAVAGVIVGTSVTLAIYSFTSGSAWGRVEASLKALEPLPAKIDEIGNRVSRIEGQLRLESGMR